MARIWIRVAILFSAAITAAWMGCSEYGPAEPIANRSVANHGTECDMTTVATVAAQAKSLLGIPDTSIVYINCTPVDTGHRYVEDVGNGIPVILAVPPTPATGNYYMLYINDQPAFGFGHAVRYAWVDFDSIT
jgi:hypothetical protein